MSSTSVQTNFLEQALKRLNDGPKKVTGGREKVVAGDVARTLIDFCRQDGEFAQAVAQGGSFADCLRAVLKGVGSGISDLDAYQRAVQFYFPGAKIEMKMVIHVNPYEAEPEPAQDGGIVLNFSDFF